MFSVQMAASNTIFGVFNVHGMNVRLRNPFSVSYRECFLVSSEPVGECIEM